MCCIDPKNNDMPSIRSIATIPMKMYSDWYSDLFRNYTSAHQDRPQRLQRHRLCLWSNRHRQDLYHDRQPRYLRTQVSPNLCSVLAIRDIFYYIEKDPDNRYDVIITYVEIYNEMIRDLLVPASGYLELRDDPEKGIVMAGVTEFRAESTEQVMNLLLIGNRRRTTEATNANLTSSRSHAVFQINIAKTSKTKNIKV